MNRSNKKLNQFLDGMGKYKFHEHTELINIVWPTFIEVEGCILLQNDLKPDRTINIEFVLKQFGDRSGFEASESHVHMIDVSSFFIKQPLEGLRFAMKLVDMWVVKLKLDFPDYSFLIILSFDGGDSIIRFHRIREDEEPWINIERIDEYKDEGISIRIV
ncbi:hypothetical protein [Paenibacillus sp. R14(2021)]|uniref:hypothetical protein n=1 Tax=Paenibacillus sp. R14(2021) TaxID=2859228 RepID=UPI001C612A4B|nr:hypothetical protein [Paenibacillus sp. R14(2021)]